MHYKSGENGVAKTLAPVKTFLDEMGKEENGKVDKLKYSKKSDLPEETEVMVITPTNA